jgi:hypothetical protein
LTPGELQPVAVPEHPFAQRCVDHPGPFQTTASGNRHIIVAVCYSTRFDVARAVPDVGAATAQRFVEEEILFKFGAPEAVISDQGSAFTGKSGPVS